ncbi:threonine/homoserine/homoserine lactone efflux protein [Kineococcus radiotolerans]|uniref:Threonine/homoserine/homoserine lactone efflux protein n=1 Tax=Kineococcus radiotolerans TaxID=131568 RepID=A0A7W4XUR4_KINRA|nr:hypothetical protein [Kineococcus radiotolerans]MBB2899236.1 threonine/homoserine/homoserine lactone efflux protein [Kineococcus radiotolerans]
MPAQVAARGRSRGRTYSESAIFFVAVLPQSTAAAAGLVRSRVLVLGTIHLLIGLAFDTPLGVDRRRCPRLVHA